MYHVPVAAFCSTRLSDSMRFCPNFQDPLVQGLSMSLSFWIPLVCREKSFFSLSLSQLFLHLSRNYREDITVFLSTIEHAFKIHQSHLRYDFFNFESTIFSFFWFSRSLSRRWFVENELDRVLFPRGRTRFWLCRAENLRKAITPWNSRIPADWKLDSNIEFKVELLLASRQ